jgi:hypothetical protein
MKWINPNEWAMRLESIHPTLAKKVLSYASRLDRSLFGLRYSLTEWSDERIGVRLQNPNPGGLISLAEFMLRVMLGRHWPDGAEGLQIHRATFERRGPVTDTALLRMDFGSHDREEWLRELLLKGEAIKDWRVPIFSQQGLQLAEVVLTAQLTRQKALSESL